MSLNGIIVYKVISFGDLVTPFFDWRPLIGHKIYYESLKYHFYHSRWVGGQLNITPYHKGGEVSREGQFCIMR